MALDNLGNVALSQGDFAGAWAYHEESLRLDRALGDRRGAAIALHNLGEVARARGDLAEAAALFAQGLDIERAVNNQRGIAESLEAIALVAAQRGEAERAVWLDSAARALRTALGAPPVPLGRDDYEREIAAARATLGAAGATRAQAEGAALSPEQAVALALGE